MLHVWGPFYIISVFPIILHLSFGDKLSQNRKIVWLSLFSLKIVESFPLHLRRQSIALSDSSIKKNALSIFFMFHTQEAPLPPPKLPWLQRLSSIFQIISDCLYCCSCCLFGFFFCFNFLFCVGNMNLKPTKDLEHVSVPWAASTNYHKFRWLKIAVIYCLQF